MDSIKFYNPPTGKTPCSMGHSASRLAKTAPIPSMTTPQNHRECFSGMVTESKSLPATQILIDDNDHKDDSSDFEYLDLYDMLLAGKRNRDLLKSGLVSDSHRELTPQELLCAPRGNDVTESSSYAMPGDSQDNAIILGDKCDDDNDKGDDDDNEINDKSDDKSNDRSHNIPTRTGEGINCLVQIISGSISPQCEDKLQKASCDIVEEEANLCLENLPQDTSDSTSTDDDTSDRGSICSCSSTTSLPFQRSSTESDYVRCLSKAQQDQYAPLPFKFSCVALSVEDCPSESVLGLSSNNLELSQKNMQSKKRQADAETPLEVRVQKSTTSKQLRTQLDKPQARSCRSVAPTSKRAGPSTLMMVRHHIPAKDLRNITRSGRRILPRIQHWKLEKVERSWDGTIQGVERVEEVQVDRSLKNAPARLDAVENDEIEEQGVEGGSTTWPVLAE